MATNFMLLRLILFVQTSASSWAQPFERSSEGFIPQYSGHFIGQDTSSNLHQGFYRTERPGHVDRHLNTQLVPFHAIPDYNQMNYLTTDFPYRETVDMAQSHCDTAEDVDRIEGFPNRSSKSQALLAGPSKVPSIDDGNTSVYPIQEAAQCLDSQYAHHSGSRKDSSATFVPNHSDSLNHFSQSWYEPDLGFDSVADFESYFENPSDDYPDTRAVSSYLSPLKASYSVQRNEQASIQGLKNIHGHNLPPGTSWNTWDSNFIQQTRIPNSCVVPQPDISCDFNRKRVLMESPEKVQTSVNKLQSESPNSYVGQTKEKNNFLPQNIPNWSSHNEDTCVVHNESVSYYQNPVFSGEKHQFPTLTAPGTTWYKLDGLVKETKYKKAFSHYQTRDSSNLFSPNFNNNHFPERHPDYVSMKESIHALNTFNACAPGAKPTLFSPDVTQGVYFPSTSDPQIDKVLVKNPYLEMYGGVNEASTTIPAKSTVASQSVSGTFLEFPSPVSVPSIVIAHSPETIGKFSNSESNAQNTTPKEGLRRKRKKLSLMKGSQGSKKDENPVNDENLMIGNKKSKPLESLVQGPEVSENGSNPFYNDRMITQDDKDENLTIFFNIQSRGKYLAEPLLPIGEVDRFFEKLLQSLISHLTTPDSPPSHINLIKRAVESARNSLALQFLGCLHLLYQHQRNEEVNNPNRRVQDTINLPDKIGSGWNFLKKNLSQWENVKLASNKNSIFEPIKHTEGLEAIYNNSDFQVLKSYMFIDMYKHLHSPQLYLWSLIDQWMHEQRKTSALDSQNDILDPDGYREYFLELQSMPYERKLRVHPCLEFTNFSGSHSITRMVYNLQNRGRFMAYELLPCFSVKFFFENLASESSRKLKLGKVEQDKIEFVFHRLETWVAHRFLGTLQLIYVHDTCSIFQRSREDTLQKEISNGWLFLQRIFNNLHQAVLTEKSLFIPLTPQRMKLNLKWNDRGEIIRLYMNIPSSVPPPDDFVWYLVKCFFYQRFELPDYESHYKQYEYGSKVRILYRTSHIS